MCDAILFVEKIARNLSLQTGRVFDELRLNREISLFEESLKLSRLLANSWEKGKDVLEHFLRSLWSLPAGARIVAFHERDHFSHDRIPLRFAPNITISEEVVKTFDAYENSFKTSLKFNIPSTCRLGEILYRYHYPLRDDEIGEGDNKIP